MTQITQGQWMHDSAISINAENRMECVRVGGEIVAFATPENATTIAALPDIVAALKSLIEQTEGNGNDHVTRACNDARAALKKGGF
jgi:hypothetical protein